MAKPSLSALSSLSILPEKGAASKPEYPQGPEPKTRAPDDREPRDPVTLRMPRRNAERLRIMAFQTRTSKQTLLDEAVEEYLTRRGY
jgi:hypothetical protein